MKGSTSILESARKYGSVRFPLDLSGIVINLPGLEHRTHIRRIVVTSGCVTIFDDNPSGELDENNWNEKSLIDVREKGRDANGFTKYSASKVLAEKCEFIRIPALS